jgi:hypothetical protein
MHKETILIHRLFFVILTTITLVIAASPAQAASDDEWEIIIAPYVFAMSADYDSTIDGQTANVDLKFKDILKDFDVMGGSLRIEAWKGDWGIILDGIFTDLDGDLGPNDNLNAKLRDVMIDLQGAYRIGKNTLLDRPFITEIFGGLRYHYLKQKAHLNASPGPGPGLSIKAGTSEDWIEPVIGGRIKWILTEKWGLLTGADMGGFGIGSASKLTWSITSLLNYQFSKHWSVAGGYRYLDMDYSRGSGNKKFGFDGTIDGVIVGITWRN